MTDLDRMRLALDLIEQAIDACDGVSEWPDEDLPIDDLIKAESKVREALALQESSLLRESKK